MLEFNSTRHCDRNTKEYEAVRYYNINHTLRNISGVKVRVLFDSLSARIDLASSALARLFRSGLLNLGRDKAWGESLMNRVRRVEGHGEGVLDVTYNMIAHNHCGSTQR